MAGRAPARWLALSSQDTRRMTGFLLFGGIGAFAVAVYPFLGYPLLLWLIRRVRGPSRRSVTEGPPQVPLPRVSVLISAANEETSIPHTLASILASDYPPDRLEVLVYSDGSSDRTAEVAAGVSSRIFVLEGGDRQGKSFGLQALSAKASGDVLVCCDANVVLEPNAIRMLAQELADESIGGTCGALSYSGGKESNSAKVSSRYWQLEEWIKALESDTGNLIGADGSLMAIRRTLFPHLPPEILPDFFVSMSVVLEGYVFSRTPAARVSEGAARSARDEFRRRIRISCRTLNCHKSIRSRLPRLSPMDRWKYLSHRTARWLSPFSMAIGTGLCTVWFWARFGQLLGAALIAALSLAMAAAALCRIPVLSPAVQALGQLVAQGCGVVLSLQGERFQVWTPPESSRSATASRGLTWK